MAVPQGNGPESLGEIGLSQFAPYLMNRIMGRYNASLRADLAALGITTPKMRTLGVLSVMDGLQVGRLAEYAVIEQSTLSRALDSLEAAGLVRRSADATDSRAIRVHITQSGRATFDRLWPAMAGAHARMFAGIDRDEQAAFIGTLTKILGNIRHDD